MQFKFKIRSGRRNSRYWRRYQIIIRAKYNKKTRSNDRAFIEKTTKIEGTVQSKYHLTEDYDLPSEIDLKRRMAKNARLWINNIKKRHPSAIFKFK